MAHNIYRRDTLENLVEIFPSQREIVTIEDNSKHAFLFYGQLRIIAQLLEKGAGIEVRGWDTNFGKGSSGQNSFDVSSTILKFGTGAIGAYSFTANLETSAVGRASTSFGHGNSSLGISSFTQNGGMNHLNVEDKLTNSINDNNAGGDASHAEGLGTKTGNFVDDNGFDVYAEDDSGLAAHAEGENTNATGTASHAQNVSTKSVGDGTSASGFGTISRGKFSSSEGALTFVDNGYSYGLVEGWDYANQQLEISADSIENIDVGSEIFYFKNGQIVFNSIVAKSRNVITLEEYEDVGTSRQELGKETYPTLIQSGVLNCIFLVDTPQTTTAIASHVEGILSVAIGNGSHAEGLETFAIGDGAHTEGRNTWAQGDYAHSEGFRGRALGLGSHLEGYDGRSFNAFDHVEGFRNKIINVSSFIDPVSFDDNVLTFDSALSYDSFRDTDRVLVVNPLNLDILAVYNISQLEPRANFTMPIIIHLDSPVDYFSGKSFTIQLIKDGFREQYGESSFDSPTGGHAEGLNTISNPVGGHSEGVGTRALYPAQHAEGTFNKGDTPLTVHETGIGTETVRKNAFEIYFDGLLRAPEANDLSQMFNDLKAIVTSEYVAEKVALDSWFTDHSVVTTTVRIYRSDIPQTDKHANISAVFLGGVMLRPTKYSLINDGGFKSVSIGSETTLDEGDWISLQNSRVYFRDY